LYEGRTIFSAFLALNLRCCTSPRVSGRAVFIGRPRTIFVTGNRLGKYTRIIAVHSDNSGRGVLWRWRLFISAGQALILAYGPSCTRGILDLPQTTFTSDASHQKDHRPLVYRVIDINVPGTFTKPIKRIGAMRLSGQELFGSLIASPPQPGPGTIVSPSLMLDLLYCQIWHRQPLQ